MSLPRMFAADNSDIEVSVDVVAEAITAGTHTLLDVREQEEWDDAHISGSMLIPLSQLGERITEIPNDRPVHILCHSGQRSLYAVRVLEQAGHAGPKSLAGGIVAWVQAGNPITR